MANSVDPDQTAPIGAVYSGSTLFASILNTSVMLGDDFSRQNCQMHFFLDALRVNPLLQDFSCQCYPGYDGKQCQIDIDECAAVPCQYNGTCHQRSLEIYYLNGTEGFDNLTYSYATAAGYVCNCIDGITGTESETWSYLGSREFFFKKRHKQNTSLFVMPHFA